MSSSDISFLSSHAVATTPVTASSALDLLATVASTTAVALAALPEPETESGSILPSPTSTAPSPLEMLAQTAIEEGTMAGAKRKRGASTSPSSIEMLAQTAIEEGAMASAKRKRGASAAIDTSNATSGLDNDTLVNQLLEAASYAGDPTFLVRHQASLSLRNSAGDNALILAVKAGNQVAVENLLRNGMSPDSFNEAGWSALAIAAVRGYTPMVKYLLESGANPNISHPNVFQGATPLIIISPLTGKSFVEIAQALLLKGANVNAEDGRQDSALIHAAKGKNAEIFAMLLTYGADINHANREGNTALIVSAKVGFEEGVTALLQRSGLQVNHRNQRGNTALHVATSTNQKRIVEALLKKPGILCVVTNENGCTPLHIAAYFGHDQIAKLLVERYTLASLIVRDNNKKTASDLASEHNHPKVELVISDEIEMRKGGSVEAPSSAAAGRKDEDGNTLLMRAIMKGDSAAVSTLLAKGVNVNVQNRGGMTPISAAISNPPIAKQLLLAGASLHFKGGLQSNPLIQAVGYTNDEELVRMILERGISIDSVDERTGSTAIMHAIIGGKFALMKVLLEAGASLSIVNRDRKTALTCTDCAGNTALMLAVKNADAAVVKRLLEAGASVDATNIERKTALDFAKTNEEIEKMLQEHQLWQRAAAKGSS